MKIINNPLDSVLEAVEGLYPQLKEKNIIIQFNPELRGLEYGECGSTFFPDDSDVVYIDISTNIPFLHMTEILAHELAHVIIGEDVPEEEEHGEAFSIVFQDIYNKYNELVDIKNADIEIVITRCPNCHSKNTRVIKQLDFDLLVKCQDCSLEFESTKGHD